MISAKNKELIDSELKAFVYIDKKLSELEERIEILEVKQKKQS